MADPVLDPEPPVLDHRPGHDRALARHDLLRRAGLGHHRRRAAPHDHLQPPEAVLANARLDQDIHRISPDELYEEATQVLLDPAARTTSSLVASSRLDQALPSSLSLDQSLSLAWWQVVSMAAAAAVIFVAAYLVFLRQEIRA